MQYPPPHYLFFEPLNDIETLQLGSSYKEKYGKTCEFDVVDAAVKNGILKIFLERKVPEELLPKTIAISYDK
jgi:hypothetical protein